MPSFASSWLFKRLGRVTSSGRYIPEVDGLRFVAIASVFLFHLRGYLGAKVAVGGQEDALADLTRVGALAVPLFFTLSGFILGLPFAAHRLTGDRPVSLRAYYLRRLTRLEPPYLIALTVTALGLLLATGETWSDLVPRYLTACFYQHNAVFNRSFDGAFWSLEVEVQFYVLAPLLALLYAIPRKATRRAVFGAVILTTVLSQWLFLVPATRASLSLLNYVQFFLAGMLFADVYVLDVRQTRGREAVWDAVSFLGWPALLLLADHENAGRFLLPWLFFVLFLALFRGRLVRRLLGLPLLATIGGMCYSIYLLHFQMISLVGRGTTRWRLTDELWINLAVQTLLIGMPTLLVSAVFFMLVEKPCMSKDWLPRLLAWFRGSRGRVSTCVPSPLTSVVPNEREAHEFVFPP